MGMSPLAGQAGDDSDLEPDDLARGKDCVQIAGRESHAKSVVGLHACALI